MSNNIQDLQKSWTQQLTDLILPLTSWTALLGATHATPLEVLALPISKHQDSFDDNHDEVQVLVQYMHSSHKTWIEDK